MHRRYVVVKDYIGSYGFRVSKGDSISPGDTAAPEVHAEILKQMQAGNLVEQGEGEEISLLNLEQAIKDKKFQQGEEINREEDQP
jgi:hypothetical protein